MNKRVNGRDYYNPYEATTTRRRSKRVNNNEYYVFREPTESVAHALLMWIWMVILGILELLG